MQLLTSLLESNPFAARLETEDLVKKLEEEEKKLAALCPEEVTWISISISSLNQQVKDPVEAWADMEDIVRSGVAKARGGDEEPIEVKSHPLRTDMNHDERRTSYLPIF